MSIRIIVALLLLLPLYLSAQNWEALGAPPASSQIISLNDSLFAASAHNLFYSTDGGTTWTATLSPENAPFMTSDYIRPAAYLDNLEALRSVSSLVLEDLTFFLVTLETRGVNFQLQQLYRSWDRGQQLELVHESSINAQGGAILSLPKRLDEQTFLLEAEGFADFVGPIMTYFISTDKGKTWTANHYAEFQQGAMRTPPFLMDLVEDKILGVEAVRTFPFQIRDHLTRFDVPELDIAAQVPVPISLDSFRLRSALYHEEAAYLFYFRIDHDGTVLLAKTSDFGTQWHVYRFILGMLSQAAIQFATFELVDDIIYLRSPDNTYYRLIESVPIQLEEALPPNAPVLDAYSHAYSLNVLADDELWVTTQAGLFQHLGTMDWAMPDDFSPYPSSQSITSFQGAYYLLDEHRRIYTSTNGADLDFVFQANAVLGLNAFEDVIFAFGERLFFSQDGINWSEISLAGVAGTVNSVLALEDELVLATEEKRFYFLRDINGNWEEIDIGSGERSIALDAATNKLYVYELPSSSLDTDISIYEKTNFGDDEWVGQGASLFGQLYPTSRFKLLFHEDQIVKLDIADEQLFISDNAGFSWKETRPGLGQIMDIALTDSYCYLATRQNGVHRTDISEILQIDSIAVLEEGDIDLALFMTVDKPQFNPFEQLVYSITIINSGVDTAKSVSVRFSPDPNSTGLAYVRAFTTKGNTRGWDNLWRNIELAPRERARLDLTYFARAAEPLTLFAEVIESAQQDRDSEPANFSVFRENEDDEAEVTAYPYDQNSLVDGNVQGFNVQQVLNVYPTLAREQVQIQVQIAEKVAPHIRVLNSAGHIILEKEMTNYEERLDINTLPKGAYIVQLLAQKQLLDQQFFFKL